jgi:serine/threonine protein kinase/tetratricopeptide (TPR) repeat protein
MPAQPLSLKEVFLAALAVPPADRAEWLRQACGQDAELRERVEQMLGAHDQSQSLIDRLAPAEDPQQGATADFTGPPSEQTGTVIGPYKLLQQIGEGGMGTVYMAQQSEPVRRLVALKIIKPGMDSRQVIARFEAERQALALMDHPHIARVFDGGTTSSGRPYFVMELVKGVPLTKYCDEQRLTPRERLALFVPVCQALQHAHQKGIIHRDIKPSNVLIALYDGKPVPKVIDFGVAKATGQQLTEHTLVTGFGAVIGTLEYMSPEQAETNQLDVDTRSDIYSLGVLLYELLTGTTPLQRGRIKEAALLEVLRLIREEEPPKPSTRLSSTEHLPSIAANRGLEPRKLSGLVRGELDWIVMKALEKQRNRRYETANGLAQDIERYLNNEAVQACPPSAGYRFRKFARRNRAAILTTGVVALALVTGTAVSIWQAVITTRALEAESRARQDADANFQAARQAVDDYFTVVGGSPLLDAPGMEPLRKQLLDTALRYNLEFIRQRGDDPQLQADVAAAHIRVAEITFLVGGSADQWFPHVREGADIVSRLVEQHQDTPEVQRRLAKINLSIGSAASSAGAPVDTRELLRCLHQQAQNWEKFVRDNPQDLELLNHLAGIYFYIAYAENPASEQLRWGAKAVQIWEKLAQENPQIPSYRMDLAKIHETLALLLRNAGRIQEAEQTVEKALVLRRELARESPGKASHSAWLAVSYRILADTQNAHNQPEQAEKTLRQALELQEKLVADFPAEATHQHELAQTQLALAAVLQKLGRAQEAQSAYYKAVESFGHLLLAFPRTILYQNQLLQAVNELGRLLDASGQSQKKSEMLDGIYTVYQNARGQVAKTPEDRVSVAWAYENLAKLLRDGGKQKEAEQAFRQACSCWQELKRDFPKLSMPRWEESTALQELASFLWNVGRHDEAEKPMRQVIELRRQVVAQVPTDLAYGENLGHSLSNLASWLGAGREQEKEQLLRDAIVVYAKLVADAPKVALYQHYLGVNHCYLGNLLAATKRPEEAERSYLQGTELLATSPGEVVRNRDRRWEVEQCLGRVVEFSNSRDRGREVDKLRRQALAVCTKQAAFNENDPDYRDGLLSLWTTAANLYTDLGQPLEAEKSIRHALAVQEKLVAEEPNNPSRRAEIGWKCRHLASLLVRQPNRFHKALEIHGKDISLFEKLAADLPNNPSWPEQLAHGHRQWAFDLRGMNRPQEAEKSFRKAIKVLESSSTKFPNAVPSHSALLADTAGVLARMLGRWEEAEQAYSKLLELAPQNADAHNNLAWLLATCPDSEIRDPKRAIELAKKATELAPKEGNHWNTLGAAYYYAGDWKAAIAALEKSMELRKGGDAFDWFFLAMARWQLGDKKDARKWYDQAVQWMDKNQHKDEELRRFRAEAETLLKIKTQPMVK